MFSTFLHCSMVLQKTIVRSQELAFNSMAFNSAARLFSNTCRHSHPTATVTPRWRNTISTTTSD